ncbi:glycosyltransferase family 8 protein [Backusella circina FSU 941]|nr:glycosyltransferase family 8 protein [Backusella circina FSU 941]
MEAYVTLVATDAYAPGALVLSHRLRDLGSQKEIVCLVTPEISTQVKDKLGEICTLIPVDTLRSHNHDNLKVLGRTELDITFTKIQLWKLTQYKKVVFLDADTYPVQNIDVLFDRPSFSAAPDSGWPDCFNSGVFVTEPSESDYEGLNKLANGKGSFDGGDQGLLNTYFSSWSNSPSKRLPFTFNTTPTAQYGYAPAHNEFSQNISIFHFIGKDKPWTYQRFTDGKVLPRGNTWDSVSDMVSKWWDTWDSHYGRVAPYHLLEGIDSSFDTGFQTRPIVPFDETTENAWHNQDYDPNDERRHVQSMPPVSHISIRQASWVQEESFPYDPYYHEHQHELNNHQSFGNDNDHHANDNNQGENNQQEDRYKKEYHHEEHQPEEHHEEHHHHEEQHHQEQHYEEHNHQEDHHHEDQQENHHYHDHQEDDHHQEHHHEEKPKKEEKVYSMIHWDPSYQEPPTTGKLDAEIPAYSGNIWDQPVQHQPIWIAPMHHPEPEVMSRPEYSHWDTKEYENSQRLYSETYNLPHEHHEEHNTHSETHHEEQNNQYQHEQHHYQEHQQEHYQEHQREHYQDHPQNYHQENQHEHHQENQHEHHQENQHEHHQENQHEHYENHHQESQYDRHHEQQENEPHHDEPHQQEHTPEPEVVHPPAFPWESNPSHFPPPSRVWLDEMVQQQQHQEEQHEVHHSEEHKEEEGLQIPEIQTEEPKPEVYVPPVPVFPWEHNPEYLPAPTRVWRDEKPSSPPPVVSSPPIDASPPQREEPVVTKQVLVQKKDGYQHHVTVPTTGAIENMMTNEVPTPLAMEIPITEKEDPIAETDDIFAIDQTTSPFEQQKINEFIASLAEDDGDISVRDLIPIHFKLTSKLNTGMYTPTNGSPTSSRPTSRRGSVAASPATSKPSSRRGSVITINPEPPITLDIGKSIKPSKIFATQSSLLTASHKTPYTSAAATPLQTPDAEKANYFGFAPLGDPIPTKTSSALMKPDFLNKTIYSLDQSLETVKVEWDPYKALSELKTQSDNMVVRKSLEASLSTSTVEGSFGEFATQKKKKSVMSYSTRDDNNGILDNKAAAASVPNISREIQSEKERYKQQYTALSLTTTQATLASTLEAELELSQGSLLKREFYENESTELPIYDDVELLAGDEVPIDEASVAYFDHSVIQESKKKLNKLLKDDVAVDTTSPLPIPRAYPIPKQEHQSICVNEMYLEPQPFSLMFDKNSYLPNFGFKDSKKFDIFSETNEDDLQDPDPILSFKLMASEMVIPNIPRRKKQSNPTKKATPSNSDDTKKQESERSDASLEKTQPTKDKSPTQSNSTVAKTKKGLVKEKSLVSELESYPDTRAFKDVSKKGNNSKSKSTNVIESSAKEIQSSKGKKLNLKKEVTGELVANANAKDAVVSSRLNPPKTPLKTAKAPAIHDKPIVVKQPSLTKSSPIESKHESISNQKDKANVTKQLFESKSSSNPKTSSKVSDPTTSPKVNKPKLDQKQEGSVKDKQATTREVNSTKISKKQVSRSLTKSPQLSELPPIIGSPSVITDIVSKGTEKKEVLTTEVPNKPEAPALQDNESISSNLKKDESLPNQISMARIDIDKQSKDKVADIPSTNPKTLKKKRARERKRAAKAAAAEKTTNPLSENGTSLKTKDIYMTPCMNTEAVGKKSNHDTSNSNEKDEKQLQDTNSSIPASSSSSKKTKKTRRHRKK